MRASSIQFSSGIVIPCQELSPYIEYVYQILIHQLFVTSVKKEDDIRFAKTTMKLCFNWFGGNFHHNPHLRVCYIWRNTQDQRWNADKPSAALDPYIPIWLTTSPAYQRPANFWKSFFFPNIERKLWKVLHFQVELVRTNLTLPFLDSSHTNNHLYIIYQSIMEMLTYFHRMSLNKNCGCMIFSVAYPYGKSMSIIERVIYIYIYQVLGIIYSRSLPCLSKATG